MNVPAMRKERSSDISNTRGGYTVNSHCIYSWQMRAGIFNLKSSLPLQMCESNLIDLLLSSVICASKSQV